jgi:Coenzyme PQQ synthesis protein D (PqqD)
MEDGMELIAPRARKTGLVVTELDGEVLVYDLERDTAHALNGTAAAVWRCCDGETTISDMGPRLQSEFEAPVTSDVIWHALAQLGNDHLLEEQVSQPKGMTRRDMMRRLGVGAIVAVPVITSIVAPTAALAAATCVSIGCACSTNATCGSGCCLHSTSQCVASGTKLGTNATCSANSDCCSQKCTNSKCTA